MDAKLSEEQKTILRAVVNYTLNCVVELIDFHGLQVDETYFDYMLLKAALKRKHKSLVNFLLKKECRVRNANEMNCDTPLHYAVELGDLVILRKLLKKGAKASISDKNSDEKTPLILAAEKLKKKENVQRHRAILMTMLSFYDFENVHPINEQSLAHFHIACDEGTEEDVKNFVDCGFPVNSHAASSKFFNWNGNTPLHFAVKNFDEYNWARVCENQLITYLLENEADYSLMNSEKKTPIHFAYYLLRTRSASDVIGTIFSFSLEKKQYINSVDKFGLSHFHICCALNKPEVIEQFIKNKEDINCAVSLDSDKNPGYTPLHFAVQNCHENIIDMLLKHGADVSLKCKNGSTPLHLACQFDQVKITELLLKFGAKLTAQDNKGCIPVHCAFYEAQKNDLVSLLLAKTPKDVNYTDSDGLSIFHIACTRNNTEIVEHFLKQGVSPNLCTASDNKKYPGFSPIHFAVEYNKKATVQLLLKYGADPNLFEKSTKITPLHTSCMHSHAKFYELRQQEHRDWISHHQDHIDIVKLLLQQKADVNAKDSSGKTALIYLCELSKSPLINYEAEWKSWCTNKVPGRQYEEEEHFKKEVLKEVEKRIIDIASVLISCNADINACTDRGESILHVISEDNNNIGISKNIAVILADLFLKNKANVQIADQEKLTPLHTAVKNRKRHLVDIFLNYNANINARTVKLMTPLQIAVVLSSLYSQSYDPIVELLLENGCDVDNQNLEGETALHLAISCLNSPIVKQLLCYGANINCEDAHGRPPVFNLFKGAIFENIKIFKLLRDHIEKLEMIGVRIGIKSKKHLLEWQEKYFSRDDNIHDEDKTHSCEFELEKMKNTKVDQFTSLYNVLFKDDIEMSRLVKNNHLKNILTDELEKKFPRYGDILKLKFRKGTEKIAILDNAKESLGFVTGFPLPDSCSERIFRYLTNNDLSTLIKVKSEVSRKRKMNFDSEKTEITKTKQIRLEK